MDYNIDKIKSNIDKLLFEENNKMLSNWADELISFIADAYVESYTDGNHPRLSASDKRHVKNILKKYIDKIGDVTNELNKYYDMGVDNE